MVGVLHDRSKIQDNTSKESNDAIFETKEMKTTTNLSSMLNPDKALKLFKKILDVV